MQARALKAYFVLLLLVMTLAGARVEAPSPEVPDLEPADAPGYAARSESVREAPPAAVVPSAGEKRRLLVAHHEGCGHTCESATSACFRATLRAQNPDGSWGSDAEAFEGRIHTPATATSLTLLSLLGAGYTHLAKETTSDGLCIGDGVKRAMKWLSACEPVDAYESSLVALALSESYGLTGSMLFRQSAQDSVDRLMAWQRYDATGNDPVAEAWAAEAVASARLAGLDFDAESADRAQARLGTRLEEAPDAPAAAAWILLTKDHDHEGLAAASTALAASLPDWEHPDFTGWFFGTFALQQVEGPTREGGPGENWKAWTESLKSALIANQQRDGTWPGVSGPTGSAVRNALAALALEIYYRYANTMGVR